MTPSPKFVHDSGDLEGPAVLVHGGAGTFERLREEGARARLENALDVALSAGWRVLEGGGPALLAVVEAVVSLEDSALFNAGRGSRPTSEGQIETDASVMDGATGAAGAVCAATWPANPVRAALAVAGLTLGDAGTGPPVPKSPVTGSGTSGAAPGPGDHGRRGGEWHPLLLAGAGADRLAEATGLPPLTKATPPSDGADRQYEKSSPGTVGAVALDGAGHLAAATSTGGLEGQPPGRVGDSAIVGAGTWADDRTVAVSATGVGEAFILAGFAHRVDWLLQSGLGLDDALAAALDEVSFNNGRGGAIALTPSGRFAAMFGTAAMARGWKSAGGLVVRM
jgi:L-asparaginase / beta-aspartyl-peptidase